MAVLGVWGAAMAAMMLPSELPLFRLDFATVRSPARTVALSGATDTPARSAWASRTACGASAAASASPPSSSRSA